MSGISFESLLKIGDDFKESTAQIASTIFCSYQSYEKVRQLFKSYPLRLVGNHTGFKHARVIASTLMPKDRVLVLNPDDIIIGSIDTSAAEPGNWVYTVFDPKTSKRFPLYDKSPRMDTLLDLINQAESWKG